MLPALVRKWLNRPKRSDTRLLAQFFYADEEVTRVVSELHCFEMQKDPQHYLSLLNELHHTQERMLALIAQISEQCIPQERHLRDYQMKFPDELLNDNMSTHMLFAAELLVAGTYIEVDEADGIMLSPLAREVLYSLEELRTVLREQSLTDPSTYTEPIHKALIQFDALSAEFELRYVSLVVSVKTPEEIYKQQEIVVLFCETITRLSIISGLLIYPDGPLNLQRRREDMSKLFSPFYGLLKKIRDLLYVLSEEELFALEKSLCSADSDDPQADLDTLAVSPECKRSSTPVLSAPSSYGHQELPQVDTSPQPVTIGPPQHTADLQSRQSAASCVRKMFAPKAVFGAVNPSRVQGAALDHGEWQCLRPEEVLQCVLHFQKHPEPGSSHTAGLSTGPYYSEWAFQTSASPRHTGAPQETAAATPIDYRAPQEEVSPRHHGAIQEAVSLLLNEDPQEVVSPEHQATIYTNLHNTTASTMPHKEPSFSASPLHHMAPQKATLPLHHSPSQSSPVCNRTPQNTSSQSPGTIQAVTSLLLHKAPQADSSLGHGVFTDSELPLYHGIPQDSFPMHRGAPRGSASPVHRGAPRGSASPVHRGAPRGSASPVHRGAPRGSASPVHRGAPRGSASPVHRGAPRGSASPTQRGMPQAFASPVYHGAPHSSSSPARHGVLQDSASPMHCGMSQDSASLVRHGVSPMHYAMPQDSAFPMYYGVPQDFASPVHHGMPQDSATPMHHGVPQNSATPMHHGVAQDFGSQMHHGVPQDYCFPTHSVIPQGFASPLFHRVPHDFASSLHLDVQVSALPLHSGASRFGVPESSPSTSSCGPAQEAAAAPLVTPIPMYLRTPLTPLWIQDSYMTDNLANLERSMLDGGSQVPGTYSMDLGSSGLLKQAVFQVRDVMRGSVYGDTAWEHCRKTGPPPATIGDFSRHWEQNSRPVDDQSLRRLQKAREAMRAEIRARYCSTRDMLHRLFVCIAGVADQLQTNFASDLRPILKTVFEIATSKPETSEPGPEEESATGPEGGSCDTGRGSSLEGCALCLQTEDEENRDCGNEPPEWVPDSASSSCMDCRAPFTLVRRRHHCRSCGKIFCFRCSPHMVPLPRFGQTRAVRVCNHCFTSHVPSREAELQ